MRLIDADEIIKETYGVVIKDMFHMDETVDVISRKDIDNAPTIEAIPIEWIKEQVADGYYDICEIMYHWERENNIKENILFGGENDF